MSRVCTICPNERLKEIELALIQGEPLRGIARRFEISEDSLARHKEHVKEVLSKVKEQITIGRATSLQEQLVELRNKTEEILANATDELALKAIDRRHKQIEIEAKLRGEFQEPKPNENLTDEQRAKRTEEILSRGKLRLVEKEAKTA